MIWILMFLLAIVIELLTSAFIAIFFAVGSVFAGIAYLFNAPIFVQFLTFFITTGLSIWLLKPLRDRYLTKNIVKTNVDAMIGVVGVVEEEVCNNESKGSVKVNGLVYTARSFNGDKLPVGMPIVVIKIEGVKLICQPVQD